MTCDICKSKITPHHLGWDGSHNAEPVVKNGKCCDVCNTSVVIPARIMMGHNNND